MFGLVKALFTLPFGPRQTRLARARQPLTKAEFVQQITDRGGDADAAGFLWNMLQDFVVVEGFTAYPTDSLGSVFGIAEEELDEDMILTLLTDLGIPIPDQEYVLAFGVIDTPLHVALFIARCRERTP